jgi:hypothetical protein
MQDVLELDQEGSIDSRDKDNRPRQARCYQSCPATTSPSDYATR